MDINELPEHLREEACAAVCDVTLRRYLTLELTTMLPDSEDHYVADTRGFHLTARAPFIDEDTGEDYGLTPLHATFYAVPQAGGTRPSLADDLDQDSEAGYILGGLVDRLDAEGFESWLLFDRMDVDQDLPDEVGDLLRTTVIGQIIETLNLVDAHVGVVRGLPVVPSASAGDADHARQVAECARLNAEREQEEAMWARLGFERVDGYPSAMLAPEVRFCRSAALA